MYLLDANVLITAHNNYYAIDQVPEYWGWLVDQAGRSSIKMPIEIIEEVKAGSQRGSKERQKAERALVRLDRKARPRNFAGRTSRFKFGPASRR